MNPWQCPSAPRTASRGRTRLLSCVGRWLVLLASGFMPARSQAQDNDAFRPYLGFRYGEFDARWNVHDLWGFSLGANLDRHWGVELSSDIFQEFLDDGVLGKVGEESVITLMPQVRYRLPLGRRRLVPYVVGGAGPAFLQFNDRTRAAAGVKINAEGTVPAVALGGGLDYFVMDNVALNLEGKYLWVEPLSVSLGAKRTELDLSSALMTVGLRVYFRENEPRPLAAATGSGLLRPYFGLRLGGSGLIDRRLDAGLRLGNLASSKFSTFNKAGGVALGVNLGDRWGFELAGDTTEFNLVADPLGAVGEYAVYTVIPELVLRQPVGAGRWVAYAQTGAGLAYGEFNDAKPRSQGQAIRGKGMYPAMRADLGAEYFLISNFSVHADLRYLYTWSHDFRINATRFRDTDFSAFQIQLGFRIYFNRPPAS